MKKTACIILAAGKGKRMGSDLPKPLIDLDGKPFIKHLLDSIKASGVCDTPVIVVGNQAKLVMDTLGPEYTYVEQTEQLGTGHAVKVCRDAVEGTAESVLVLYADHPFVCSDTIASIVALQHDSGAVMSMATITVPDFEDWRVPMYSYGRIIRDTDNKIAAVVERKDATEKQLDIKEVSPSFFCFDARWLWENLEDVKNENAQQEYYLPDLVKIACQQGLPIASADVDAEAAIGINTPEELALAKEFISKNKT